MATLDKSKSFGTVHGINEFGAIFCQDGKYFNAMGEEVGPNVEPEVVKEPEPVKEPVIKKNTAKVADIAKELV